MQSQKGEDEESTWKAGEDEGGGGYSRCTPSMMSHVSAGTTAQTLDSQPNVTNSDKRMPDLEARMRRIRAERRVHRQILHGTMTAFSEKIHPIYNEDHGAHHFYMDVDYVAQAV